MTGNIDKYTNQLQFRNRSKTCKLVEPKIKSLQMFIPVNENTLETSMQKIIEKPDFCFCTMLKIFTEFLSLIRLKKDPSAAEKFPSSCLSNEAPLVSHFEHVCLFYMNVNSYVMIYIWQNAIFENHFDISRFSVLILTFILSRSLYLSLSLDFIRSIWWCSLFNAE